MKQAIIFYITIIGFIPASVVAQVLVKNEPRHKRVLENKFVRVLDVVIQPGDTSLYHIHQTPSVFIILSETFTGTQEYKSLPTESKSKSEIGNAWYNPFAKPLTHRVWNSDQSTFHVMDIELLSEKDAHDPDIFTNSNLKLVKDEPKARIYKFQLSKSEEINLNPLDGPVVIFPTKSIVAVNSKDKIALGEFRYLDKGKVNLNNEGNEPAEGIIFQIK